MSGSFRNIIRAGNFATDYTKCLTRSIALSPGDDLPSMTVESEMLIETGRSIYDGSFPDLQKNAR